MNVPKLDQSKARNKCQTTVVVLGTARSGTSLIGGILSILGVDIGDKLVEADALNPSGYFEDKDFVNFNDRIFEAAKSNYWQFPFYRKIQAQKEKFDKKIQELIRKKSKDKQIWGWKDPWTNLTIELFLPYLVNPCFIIIFRDIIDTAKSSVEFTEFKESECWVKRRIDFFHALKLANFYERIILNFLEKYPNLPRIFMGFEDIVKSPIKESKKIADFLGIKFTKQKIERIKKLVMPRNKIKLEKKIVSEEFKN